ncbi:MAG: histone deacetylase [Candidatus Promineifilaceae bacterium]
MVKPILVSVPAKEHTLEGHPENAGRVEAILRLLEKYRVTADLLTIAPQIASIEQLTRVHTKSMVELVRQAASYNWHSLDADTYITPSSYDLARLAAGSAAAAVDSIMTGQAKTGLALLRPPGHHAERNSVGGFCLFNNVAVAARQAQVVHGAKRVLIIDFDVHHGNGTQDIFYDDPEVLFISLHLYLSGFFYPGTGGVDETGSGSGVGTTMNVPMPLGVGDEGYLRAFTELIRLKAESFDPDLILVSAGYDAHWADPLTPSDTTGLSLTGYARMVRKIVEMAETVCGGRVLFILEGGYYFPALSHGVLNTLYALLGRDEIVDPLGPAPEVGRDISQLLHDLRQRHLLI